MKLCKLIPTAMMVILLAGCSTMYGRQNDKPNVFFEANVAEVAVTCSGETVQTPGNIALRQSKTHKCTAAKEGFEPQTFKVHSVISKDGFDHSTQVNWEKWGKWTLGIGNLVAWPVDFISGSMRSLEKDRYILEMKSSGETGAAKKALSKTVSATKSLLTLPGQVADQTATELLDKTVRTSSQGIGIANLEKRQKVEDTLEGKKLVKRYEAESQES